MMLFQVGEEKNHRKGDRRCPECPEEFPEPCRCGGLMHAAVSETPDADDGVLLITRCDSCGRSEDQLDNN